MDGLDFARLNFYHIISNESIETNILTTFEDFEDFEDFDDFDDFVTTLKISPI